MGNHGAYGAWQSHKGRGCTRPQDTSRQFWNTKPNGDVFLLRIGERLKKRFENIQLIEFMPGKADSAIGAPAVALKEAATRCDAVLLSTGD
jgi:hypothetical protein